MRVLVVDIGGTGVKILATGEKTPREFPSAPTLTPRKMAAGVKKLAAEWKYDAPALRKRHQRHLRALSRRQGGFRLWEKKPIRRPAS